MVRHEVNFIKDTLAEKLFIVGGGSLTGGTVVLDLECAGPDLIGDESVSLGLRQKIFFILEHRNYN